MLRNPDILKTFLPNGDEARRAHQMLLCNKVYITKKEKKHPVLLQRRYQIACIQAPHPEYMCQGGPMYRTNLLKLINTIKQGIPEGPLALSIVQDVERVMLYLDMWDGEAVEDLQVDYQICLYLLKRILSEETTSRDFLPDSELIILSAANQVTETYALQLWASPPI